MGRSGGGCEFVLGSILCLFILGAIIVGGAKSCSCSNSSPSSNKLPENERRPITDAESDMMFNRCPVCHGSGSVTYDPQKEGACEHNGLVYKEGVHTHWCSACNGTGKPMQIIK